MKEEGKKGRNGMTHSGTDIINEQLCFFVQVLLLISCQRYGAAISSSKFSVAFFPFQFFPLTLLQGSSFVSDKKKEYLHRASLGSGRDAAFFRNSSASGRGDSSFSKTEDFVGDHRVFLVASDTVSISIGPFLHLKWKRELSHSQFEAPLLLTELSSKSGPRKVLC